MKQVKRKLDKRIIEQENANCIQQFKSEQKQLYQHIIYITNMLEKLMVEPN